LLQLFCSHSLQYNTIKLHADKKPISVLNTSVYEVFHVSVPHAEDAKAYSIITV
jgi:hypothetical protein